MVKKSVHPPIRKAIIAVAGLGTRFLPATKAIPKEMLPVVDKPVVQYIVEEAVDAGIEEIIFITSLGKRALEDHFDYNFELSYKLKAKGKFDVLEEMKKISNLASFAYVRQPLPLGDGHAILMARHLVQNEPVVVMWGDELIHSPRRSALRQMLDVYETYGDPVIATCTVPRKDTKSYGIIDGVAVQKGVYQVKGFVEKPEPKNAPSTEAAIGKYVVTPALLAELEAAKPGHDGEIRLADALKTYVKRHPVYACSVQGERFDCGSKLGWLQANVAFALKSAEHGKEFKKFLRQVC
ncbi:MAG: UTP--glucose-1-phosphate uridylyltransferase GalU [Parcubacteria group bacterium]|nr:UTP--glucose-1-phosphate uridylyltransferase GalU [Parcubacteria group bacterium]